MNCYLHTDREAVGACTSCGQLICGGCAVEMDEKLVCRECLSTGKTVMPQRPTMERPMKDRSLALVLEILPALFGLFGFGWIYSGNTSTGVAWLVGVLIWDLVAVLILTLTAGFGCIFTIPINLVLVAISASSLNTYIKKHPELFGQ